MTFFPPPLRKICSHVGTAVLKTPRCQSLCRRTQWKRWSVTHQPFRCVRERAALWSDEDVTLLGCRRGLLSTHTHTHTAWMRAQDCGQSLPLLPNVCCWKQRHPQVSCVIIERVAWGHRRVKMTMQEKASALNVGCLVVQGDEQDILNVMYI